MPSEQEIRAREYWRQYEWAIPLAEAEEKTSPTRDVDYKQYLPEDPTHPRAWIPPYVRYAKRKAVEFTCPITGWHENDYYQDYQGKGPVRQVGRLTMDHHIPGAIGGLTTDENIRAICMLANTKKGSTAITDEELRDRILRSYHKLNLHEDVLHAFEVLKLHNIPYYRIGDR